MSIVVTNIIYFIQSIVYDLLEGIEKPYMKIHRHVATVTELALTDC